MSPGGTRETGCRARTPLASQTRRRVGYLGTKLNRCPEEARTQLEEFGCGLGFLEDCLGGAIVEIQDRGFLPPNVVDCTVKLCGALPGPESIRANPMAYLIHIYNLGCTPDAPAEEIKHWLEPSNRPEGHRDRSCNALCSGDADVCGRLVGLLQGDLDQARGLDERITRDVDHPSLKAALDRASILTDAAARRVGRSRAEARTTFHRALNDLIKMLKRDAKEGPYDPVGDYQAEPEKDVADLTQLVDQAVTYANALGSMAGAQTAQNGEQPLSKTAQSGAETRRFGEAQNPEHEIRNEFPDSTDHGPRITIHKPRSPAP